MRVRLELTCVMFLCISAFCQSSPATSPAEPCAIPAGLREEISRKYPNARVVNLADLDEGDRKLFQHDHGTQCPGIVKVDFYGDGRPAWALVLILGIGSKMKADLVMAHQVGDSWETNLLESADASVPVVWSEGPGKYRDVYGEKTIRATHPVVVFYGYSTWAIVYAWTARGVEKVWIRD